MRILIADDDSVSRHLLEVTLVKWGYDVTVCKTGDDAWQELQRDEAPQLAILDWEMPHVAGPEVCRRLRQRGAERYTYLILLTGRSHKQDLITGMNAGADDYLTKPFDAHELEVRLRAAIRILDLQHELITTREALRIQATRDALTGLLNRRAIVETLSTELHRVRRESRPMGVAIADLDSFKRINDTHGHAAGDGVLVEAARRMRASLRPYDEIGRTGGEEFLIVAPGCTLACVGSIAERMRAALASEPMRFRTGTFSVTCSIGVASTAEHPGRDVDWLIRAADAALYRAKAAGRNAVREATSLDGQEV
jgi:two-component system, cell cycle response regulator